MRLGKNIPGMEKDALDLLKNYSWPGNIRELKNVIKNGCLRTPEGHHIAKKDFSDNLFDTQHEAFFPAAEPPVDLVDTQTNDIKQSVRSTEILIIQKILKSVNYNKSRAAAILKIDRKTLYNKLKGFSTLPL